MLSKILQSATSSTRHSVLRMSSSSVAMSTQPKTLQLSEKQMTMVLRPTIVKLAAIFAKHDHEIRVAGGAVRDLLRGLDPHDLDFATTATPTEMKEMFTEESVRMINETGEKHGTITVRLDEENFECTTLRIDIRTNGRHAEVQYTKDWYLDSNRRDLTFNSMFLGLDGTVYDYFDGKAHLEEHRVEFVGDPDNRIQEDYLRIFRYFRFYGRISEEPHKHSRNVLDAITRNSAGLTKISGERIWSELQKIAVGCFAGELIDLMMECKLGSYMGLPDSYDSKNCTCMIDRCSKSGTDPRTLQAMTVMAAGFRDAEQTFTFIERIKCSKKERELLVFVVDHTETFLDLNTSLKDAQDLLADLIIDMKVQPDLARQRVRELLCSCGHPNIVKELEAWVMPKFPVNGHMVTPKLEDRKITKYVLRHLLDLWKKSDFLLTADELLESVDGIQEKIKKKM